MYSLQEIIHHLYNIRECRTNLYMKYVNGFLIEIDDKKIIKWDLKTSKELFKTTKKIAILHDVNSIELKSYAYIKRDNTKEFFEKFGMPAASMLEFLINHTEKPKKSSNSILCLKIFFKFIFPIMMIVIFIKVISKRNKKKNYFNYFHTCNISDVIYKDIVNSNYTTGFNLDERKAVLRKAISEFSNKDDSPCLDLGCGTQSLLLECRNDDNIKIYLLDPSSSVEEYYKKLTTTEKNVEFIRGCGEDLIFEDNFFSFIYCGGVIAHVCHLEKFINECYRILKPGGIILFDESNEYPRVNFVTTEFTKNLESQIKANSKISENYKYEPPEDYECNPWTYWGCSTDHFFILNSVGIKELLEEKFKIIKSGSIASYLRNNGQYKGNPLFYNLNLGSFTDTYIDFRNLPYWYINLINKLVNDLGIYIYVIGEKKGY